jgi:hypothetical protein
LNDIKTRMFFPIIRFHSSISKKKEMYLLINSLTRFKTANSSQWIIVREISYRNIVAILSKYIMGSEWLPFCPLNNCVSNWTCWRHICFIPSSICWRGSSDKTHATPIHTEKFTSCYRFFFLLILQL